MAHSVPIYAIYGAKMRTKTSGQGRKKGVPNKTTKEVREVIAMVSQKLAPEVEGWFKKVASKSPEKALDLYFKMIEYHIPKLARTEVTGGEDADGNKMPVLQVVVNRAT